MNINVGLICAFLLMLVGCGEDSLQDKAKKVTSRAGQFVGENATSFFSGIGEGVDSVMTDFDMRVSSALKEFGVEVTIGKQSAMEDQDALSFYILNEKPVSGAFRLKMFNAQDEEIGRSVTEVEFGADDAQYVQFLLDDEIPLMMVQYIELDMK